MMKRKIVQSVITSAVALIVGACSGRVLVSSPPGEPIVVTPSTSDRSAVPGPTIAVLPVRELHLDLLASSVVVLPKEEKKGCDIAAIVADTAADPVLRDAPLRAGTQLNRYIEVRLGAVRPYKDYVKDVALRVLDLETCTTQVITITKAYGSRMIAMPTPGKQVTTWQQQNQPAAIVQAPRGWDISVVRRANGIEWNNWATAFQVNAPANKIVVGLKYPIVEEQPARGKSRITAFTYVPHGEELLHVPELVARGPSYGDELYSRAADILRERKVMSKAIPGTLVVDVPLLTPELSFRRVANEHMDQFEFTLEPDWATRRIFMVIGANGDQFGSRTCSPAAACGPRQFIEGTWRLMASTYPSAKLQKTFAIGASDAVESTMASMLLDDTNLHALMEAFGPGIVNDSRVEEYLTAAYNTGVGRVITVLRIAKQKNVKEWTDARGARCSKATRFAECLLPETKGYIAKLRYLKDDWPKERDLALIP